MNALNSSTAHPGRRKRNLRWAGVLLVILIVAGVYRWTTTYRAASDLQNASLATLQAITRREPYNQHAFYQIGLRWQQIGNAAAAEAALERAATLDTDDEPAWLAWAALKSAVDQDAESIRILSYFLTTHPESAQAHLALARCHHHGQAYKRACAEAEAAARLQPRLVESWRQLGKDTEAIQDLPRAEQALRQALTCDPKDPVNAFDLGSFLERHDRSSEAAAYFREADKCKPDQPVILLALGQALLKTAITRQEVDIARGSLERSAHLRPGHPQTCLAVSDSYLRQQRWQEALAALKPLEGSSMEGLENQLRYAYQRAQIYQRVGRIGDAAREQQRHGQLLHLQAEKAAAFDCIQQRPTDPAPRLNLARLCSRCGDYAEADAVYRKLLEYVPQSQVARREMTALESAQDSAAHSFVVEARLQATPASDTAPAVLLEDGDRLRVERNYPEAKAAYLQALTRDRRSGRACAGIGLCLESEGDVENAFAYLQQALTLDPHLASAQRTLAKLYFQAGFPKEAKRRLLLAVKASPQDAAGWHDLGLVYRALGGQASQAEEAFRHADSLAPRSAVYLVEWADALAESGRMAQAESIYRRALASEPGNAATVSRLGAFLLESRLTPARIQEAEQLLERADRTEPNNAFTLYHLGRLSLQRHADQKAVLYLKAALRQQSGMANAWYALAQACSRTGAASEAAAALVRSRQLQEAFAAYTRTVGLVAASPEQANLRLQLARQNALQGENAYAINQYQVCLRLDPQNRAARQELTLLKDRLKAEGHMPSMSLYNAMVNSFSNKRLAAAP